MHGGSIAEFIIGDEKYNYLQKLPMSLKLLGHINLNFRFSS